MSPWNIYKLDLFNGQSRDSNNRCVPSSTHNSHSSKSSNRVYTNWISKESTDQCVLCNKERILEGEKENKRELETENVHTKHRSFPSPHGVSEHDHSMTSAAVLVQNPSYFGIWRRWLMHQCWTIHLFYKLKHRKLLEHVKASTIIPSFCLSRRPFIRVVSRKELVGFSGWKSHETNPRMVPNT